MSCALFLLTRITGVGACIMLSPTKTREMLSRTRHARGMKTHLGRVPDLLVPVEMQARKGAPVGTKGLLRSSCFSSFLNVRWLSSCLTALSLQRTMASCRQFSITRNEITDQIIV